MKRKILLLGAFILTLMVMTGCTVKKDAITSDEFISQAEGSGLKCDDVTNEYSDNSKIKKATYAEHEAGWSVYFFALDSQQSAKSLFGKNKKRLESEAQGGNTTFIDTSSYESYRVKVKNEYYYICYIGDTFLSIHVDKKHESEVKAFCDKIGY